MCSVCVFCIITLCDSPNDDEGGEDACVGTGAAVKGSAPAGGQVWIVRRC